MATPPRIFSIFWYSVKKQNNMPENIKDLLGKDLSGFQFKEISTAYYRSADHPFPKVIVAAFTDDQLAQESVKGKKGLAIQKTLVLTDSHSTFLFSSTHSLKICATADEAEEVYKNRANAEWYN